MEVRNGINASAIKEARWIKSTASQGVGNCVEVTDVIGVGVAVRNSRFPQGPALVFSPEEIKAFLIGAKSGEFDHLAG
ncbi:DUF397 domain-containing protein [Streptomyces leeuwenhoekii]|uniref:DUF397 domain-containing protein n=1 Tax=Streptomyces leeuwenhoekii TaxID=1437453 RepID=UPI00368BD2FA